MISRRTIVLALAVAALAPASAVAAPPPYRVLAVRPYLFFNDDGSFSREVPRAAPLWNTVIGEGWAGKASDATLVRVEIGGEPGSYAPHRSVRLLVRAGIRRDSGIRWEEVVLDRRVALPVLTARGRTTVGFWISGTGCRPLKLTATLVGQARSAATRVLGFACGE